MLSRRWRHFFHPFRIPRSFIRAATPARSSSGVAGCVRRRGELGCSSLSTCLTSPGSLCGSNPPLPWKPFCFSACSVAVCVRSIEEFISDSHRDRSGLASRHAFDVGAATFAVRCHRPAMAWVLPPDPRDTAPLSGTPSPAASALDVRAPWLCVARQVPPASCRWE